MTLQRTPDFRIDLNTPKEQRWSLTPQPANRVTCYQAEGVFSSCIGYLSLRLSWPGLSPSAAVGEQPPPTVALATTGVACIVNALRCGRVHGYLTGPLLLPHGPRRIVVRSRHLASPRERLEPARADNSDRRHRPVVLARDASHENIARVAKNVATVTPVILILCGCRKATWTDSLASSDRDCSSAWAQMGRPSLLPSCSKQPARTVCTWKVNPIKPVGRLLDPAPAACAQPRAGAAPPGRIPRNLPLEKCNTADSPKKVANESQMHQGGAAISNGLERGQKELGSRRCPRRSVPRYSSSVRLLPEFTSEKFLNLYLLSIHIPKFLLLMGNHKNLVGLRS